jgi:DNA-binding GntR family transcriptional regulator
MSGPNPIYHRIQLSLRMDIQRGRFAEGDRLPSESELARAFSTTRGTVRQALARLEYEGLIQREAGRGTFATPSRVQQQIDTRMMASFEEQIASQGATVTLQLLSFEACPAPESVAHALRLISGTEAYRLRRLRFVDGEVMSYEDRWMLREYGRKIKSAALKTDSSVMLMNGVMPEPLSEMEVFVRAATVDQKIAKLLTIRANSAVLIRAHTFYDKYRRPVLTGQSIYRGDRYQFSYTLHNPGERKSGAL